MYGSAHALNQSYSDKRENVRTDETEKDLGNKRKNLALAWGLVRKPQITCKRSKALHNIMLVANQWNFSWRMFSGNIKLEQN